MHTQVAIQMNLDSVIIADRNAHFREALRRVLDAEHGAAIAGEAGTLREAIRLVESTGARVVLLDVDLVMDQPAARLRRIISAFPGLEVIVLLNEDLPGYRRAIAERWGYECVAKERAESELPATLATLADRRRRRSS